MVGLGVPGRDALMEKPSWFAFLAQELVGSFLKSCGSAEKKTWEEMAVFLQKYG